jgi:hypothetical protein
MTDEEIEEIKEMRKAEMPLAGPPEEAPVGGGGGAAPAGGIEGEFSEFAKGKEGEEGGEEEIPPEGEEVPKAQTPEKPEGPITAKESRGGFFKKPLNIEIRADSFTYSNTEISAVR